MRRRMKVAAPLPLMVLRLASWGTVQVTVALPALEQEVTAERSPAENTPSRFQSTQPAILVLLPEQVISWLHFWPTSVQMTRSQLAGRASSSSISVVLSLDASAVWVMLSSWSVRAPRRTMAEFVVATFPWSVAALRLYQSPASPSYGVLPRAMLRSPLSDSSPPLQAGWNALPATP